MSLVCCANSAHRAGRRLELIVVSSDLSHYHSYEIARRLDRATAAAIERGDWASLGPNQACGSNAHRINQGSMPDLSPPETESDFYFVPADTPETAIIRIVELVKTRIPKRFGLDPIRDIQVLCPMNRGGVGARSLNIELQSVLNPAGDRKVERFGWTFAPGDKVMQIENDYEKEVYNGDIGMIDNVDPDAGELVVSFDGRPVTYGFGELDMLVPAYASNHSQEPGLGISRRYHSGAYAALPHAAAEFFFILASPAANGWSCWLGRGRPSPSRCVTSQAGGGGRSWQSGCSRTRSRDQAKSDGRTRAALRSLAHFATWASRLIS